LDDRVETSFGRRSVEWELKGVPVRIEVGPRDLAEGLVVVVRRDRREKRSVVATHAASAARADLDAAQADLYREQLDRLEAQTRWVATRDEAAAAAMDGFAIVPWDAVGAAGEAELAAGGLSVRCLQREDGSLAEGDDEPGLLAVIGRAY
jgi:prolyl-tRNA synthetase